MDTKRPKSTQCRNTLAAPPADGEGLPARLRVMRANPARFRPETVLARPREMEALCAPGQSCTPAEFRRRHLASICWSNPEAPDYLLIIRALVRPMPEVLEDAAAAFGLPRLERAWEDLQLEGASDPEVRRAKSCTERILGRLRGGLEHAD